MKKYLFVLSLFACAQSFGMELSPWKSQPFSDMRPWWKASLVKEYYPPQTVQYPRDVVAIVLPDSCKQDHCGSCEKKHFGKKGLGDIEGSFTPGQQQLKSSAGKKKRDVIKKSKGASTLVLGDTTLKLAFRQQQNIIKAMGLQELSFDSDQEDSSGVEESRPVRKKRKKEIPSAYGSLAAMAETLCNVPTGYPQRTTRNSSGY